MFAITGRGFFCPCLLSPVSVLLSRRAAPRLVSHFWCSTLGAQHRPLPPTRTPCPALVARLVVIVPPRPRQTSVRNPRSRPGRPVSSAMLAPCSRGRCPCADQL